MSSSGSEPTPDSSAGGEENNPKPEEQKSFSFYYGIIMVRTKKLLNLIDSLARYKIFARLGWLMLAITIAAAAFMIWLMVDSTYLVLASSLAFKCAVGAAPPSVCHQQGLSSNPQPPLQAILLLPGINPYIPILYGLIGIIVAVVIHEGTHGVIARSLKLPVKSTGVLFLLIVPIGAFVELDDKMVLQRKFRDSGRIMAGGPGSNIIVAAVALILLVLIVGGLVPQHFNGVYVGAIVPNSPADKLHSSGDLQAGDLIVAANGTLVHSQSDLASVLSKTKPNESLVLTIQHSGQDRNYPITLGTNPNNRSIGFIGIASAVSNSDLVSIKNNYAYGFVQHPSLQTFVPYLIIPGLFSGTDTTVPFSSTLTPLYTSPLLGAAWYPIALTLFWIWFINANLAFFNAIPLYPLDGGQALYNFFSHFGRKWVEQRAQLLTGISSVIMFMLILSYIFLPRLLAIG
jgi:membrane-associated protease RseP (regulator of RpoE activity)